MNQKIISTSISTSCLLDIKREDLLHPIISGNKYRKLKYTIAHLKNSKQHVLLTFGGAFSNHIAAVAAAGNLHNIKTIGIVRGEELENNYANNSTLLFAKEQGMEFMFVSRSIYKTKDSPEFITKLKNKFGNFYLLPEGGTNSFAIKGCAEILTPQDYIYDYICVAVGTGGTLAGIVSSLLPHQKAIGFSVLKGTFQKEIVNQYTTKPNFEILDDYNFGGYAKINPQLIGYINQFKTEQQIQLDPIYTGKLMYGIFDLIKKGYFRKNSRILAIHTGGLQGVSGMNQKLAQKQLPQIIQ